MVFKEFLGKKLSALGFGAMRLPVMSGNDSQIDIEKTRKMVAYAMKNGVNYYDTAWGYHGGQSELVMGEILSEYPRESYYLASKFPGYDLSNMDKVQEIFEKQLEKCKTEFFDFYLFHNVCELNIDGYLDKKFGIFDYLIEQKRNGRIKHLGFSVHGTIETMERFLNAYGKDMEFCQIQLNWVDYHFQSADKKLDMLKKWNIPVWVMEPVRGGKLARLTEKQNDILKGYRDVPAVEWAFRFLQTIPEVTVTLSGMSDFEQIKQNIDIYSAEKPLTDEEMNTLFGFAKEMTDEKILPCTSCKYCITHCPQEINIPYLIELYNEHIFTGGGFIASMALGAIEPEKQPSACVGCQSCEQVCPQNIKIAEMMSDFVKIIK